MALGHLIRFLEFPASCGAFRFQYLVSVLYYPPD